MTEDPGKSATNKMSRGRVTFPQVIALKSELKSPLWRISLVFIQAVTYATPVNEVWEIGQTSLNFNWISISYLFTTLLPSLWFCFSTRQPRHFFGESPTGSNPNQMRLSVIDVVSSCSNHASHFQITEVTGRCHVPQVSWPSIAWSKSYPWIFMK